MADPVERQPGPPTSPRLSGRRHDLLQELLRAKPATVVRKALEIPRRAPGTVVPASYGQQQVWLHAQFSPNLPIYNEPVTIHRLGPLNIGAMEEAFREIVRRHEMWRTTFAWQGGELVQIIHDPPKKISLPFLDLSERPEPVREQAAVNAATQDALLPFDLSTGPLYRPRLIRFSDNDHRLFLTLHHIIFDGVSLYRVFLPEFCSLYNDFAAGNPSRLQELPIQYGDYALWHRQHIARISEAQLAYWRENLKGANGHILATDFPRPDERTFRGQMETLALSEETSASIKSLGQQEGVTLFMTLLAIYSVLLHCHTSGEDLAIGTATSGRSRTETENLIGFFLNTVVVRTRLHGDPSFRELLLRTREATLSALANDDIPFELVVKDLQPRREGGRNPLFQFLFSLEPPLAPLEPGWKFTQMDVETRAAKFDLHLELDERTDGIIGRFLYNTDLFKPQTIQLMLRNWRGIIEIVITNPDIRLSGISRIVKTPAEKPARTSWWGQLWSRGGNADPEDLPKAPPAPEPVADPKVKP